MVFVKILFCKVTLFPLSPYCTLGKEFTMHSPLLPNRGLCPSNVRTEYLHKLFGVFCMGDFFILPHLFIYSIIYLCKYGNVDINFILWITIWYYLTDFVAEVLPASGLQDSIYVPLSYIVYTCVYICTQTHMPTIYFFTFLLPGIPGCSCRLILYIFFP